MTKPLARLLLLLTAALTAASAGASELSEYLAARKPYKITQPVSAAALETLVGTSVCEIRGVVKGSIQSEDGTQVLLEGTGGGWLGLKIRKADEWLNVPNTRVRILVKASRPRENAELTAEIILAIPDEVIAAYEKQQAAKAPKKSTALSTRGGLPNNAKNWNLPANDAIPIYSDFIQRFNKKLSRATADQIAHGIIGFSIQYGVDARLIMAMVLCESSFNPNDTSKPGAMGLGQLMPSTAKGMGVRNPYDIYDNLWGTVRLVRGHMEKYQTTGADGKTATNLAVALAAYNAGSGTVRKYGGVPPYKETQNYINKVISWYKAFCGEK